MSEKTPPFDLDKTIVLPEWTVAFCRRHSEPFRREWPKGVGIVQVFTIQHVMADDRFTARFAKNDAGEIDMVPRAISAELVKIAPLCCFLGDTLFDFLTCDALSDETTKRSGS